MIPLLNKTSEMALRLFFQNISELPIPDFVSNIATKVFQEFDIDPSSCEIEDFFTGHLGVNGIFAQKFIKEYEDIKNRYLIEIYANDIRCLSGVAGTATIIFEVNNDKITILKSSINDFIRA